MIFLLGGPSHTGKTLLAQRLLEECHIPYLSIDHIKMGLIRGLADCPITPYDDDDDINTYLWPILEGIIKTNLENQQHLIIEGCYLPFDHVQRMCLENKEVLCLYLLFSPSYIENHVNDIQRYENAIEKRLYAEELTIGELKKEHAAAKQACDSYHLPYVEIQNDYEDELAKQLPILLAQIKV